MFPAVYTSAQISFTLAEKRRACLIFNDELERNLKNVSSWTSAAFIRKRHRLRPRHVAGPYLRKVKSCVLDER